MLNGTASSWGGGGGNHVQVRKFDSSVGEREIIKKHWAAHCTTVVGFQVTTSPNRTTNTGRFTFFESPRRVSIAPMHFVIPILEDVTRHRPLAKGQQNECKILDGRQDTYNHQLPLFVLPVHETEPMLWPCPWPPHSYTELPEPFACRPCS